MSRIGPGDALIGLALVALVVAALLPTYRARALERLIDDASADVEALREAASRAYETNGAWPSAAPPGRVPEAAASAFPGDSSMIHEGYTLEWRLWQRVEAVVAPPRPPPSPTAFDPDEVPPLEPIVADSPPDSVGPELMRVARAEGAVVVHSGEEPLLAGLLRRFGDGTSFVRDTTWTLVVTQEQDIQPTP